MTEPSGTGFRNGASDDGIEPDVWARLVAIVSAAAGGDADAYAQEILTWRDEFPVAGQHRMGVYLMYAISYQVKLRLRNNKPSGEELRETTVTVLPRVLQILDRATASQLEETLRVAFDMPFDGTGVTPGEFLVFAGAILGVLMSDPDAELATIRPRLAIWWRRHQEKFRAQGLLDYGAAD